MAAHLVLISILGSLYNYRQLKKAVLDVWYTGNCLNKIKHCYIPPIAHCLWKWVSLEIQWPSRFREQCAMGGISEVELRGVPVHAANWCMMASCWIGLLAIVLKASSSLGSFLNFLSSCHCKVYSLCLTITQQSAAAFMSINDFLQVDGQLHEQMDNVYKLIKSLPCRYYWFC